ncbi:hypothetical protein ACNKHV_00735 [Shigella flexneri]
MVELLKNPPTGEEEPCRSLTNRVRQAWMKPRT